jgi:hypothetical protein
MIAAATVKRHERANKMLDVLIEWRTSGMSKADCCKLHGVSVQLFYKWFQRYHDRQASAPFTELQVDASSVYASPMQALLSPTPPAMPSSVPVSKDPVMELQLSAGRRIVFYEQVSSDYLKSLLA